MWPFARTTCACAACVACCRRQPGPLAPGDFERIQAALKLTFKEARRLFVASPGAVLWDRRAGRPWFVETITPDYQNGKCVLLTDDNQCTVHADAPAGCALFDTHMDAAEGNRRGVWLYRRIADDLAYARLRSQLRQAKHYQPVMPGGGDDEPTR